MPTPEPPLRIVLLAPIRYPIAQPHAGGLESTIWNQIRWLRAQGHQVTLCAIEGSDFLSGGPDELVLPGLHWPDPSQASDITYPPGHLPVAFTAMDRALTWIADHRSDFDLVDNHCLHGIPLSWTGRLGLPMVTNLHTPVLPELLAAHRAEPDTDSHFVAVGSHTAAAWAQAGIASTVIPNAVDPDAWPLGPGGHQVVWFGRVVVEKAPHLAIEAARLAGRKIRLAGRIGDRDYYRQVVAPMLGPDAEYVGSLNQTELAGLVGSSACTLVTPVWPEPFGMVIAESLMAGTPVGAFDVGGVADVVRGRYGARLSAPADPGELARQVSELAALGESIAERQRIRSSAVDRFSLDTRGRTLLQLYRDLVRQFTFAVATR